MRVYHHDDFDGSIKIYAVASKDDGVCVVYDYLNTLTCNNASFIKIKILQLISRISTGMLQNTQKFKPLEGTGKPILHELKHNEHRLYCIRINSGFLFLHCSGNKDKQSLDIKIAKRIRKLYQEDSLRGNIVII